MIDDVVAECCSQLHWDCVDVVTLGVMMDHKICWTFDDGRWGGGVKEEERKGKGRIRIWYFVVD
jgi:hypothetical protein|tara:strand:+ start:409 stop:600 length:192 start_codon:yes stop_codon:yes gene_type:complete